ncbi:MAG TPA: chitobiase/beta-hexosaminidase C-terminal domain-containing protein, partial [Fibrobacteria bacterium]|nr:chitobiase/beta-hexosaminidase C-terminal domain-containing protein [Fibrobacteria bacterium]
HSDTLIAATVWGSRRSPILRVIYRKAVLPRPIARFGGNVDFISTRPLRPLICTLEVAASVKPGAPNEDQPIQILYRLDGARSWTPYQVGQPLDFTRTSVLTAVAAHPDYDTSAILTQTFNLVTQVAKPQLVGPTTFTSRYHQVKFTSATPGARFIYTTHPTNPPDRPDTAVTLEGLRPGQDFTVRVFAAKAGMANSEIASGTYYYQPPVAKPEVGPKQISFTDTLRITLSSSTEGARIYYTLDNQTPTLNSLLYENGPGILLNNSATLRAKAFKDGQTLSEELKVQYTLRLSAPYPNVGSLNFQDVLNVFLSAANPKARIEYTLDGGSGVRFSEIPSGRAISLSKDTTHLWAVAVLGEIKSDTAKYLYTRRSDNGVTPEPVFDPGAGDFTDRVTVRLVAPTSSTTIYYSRDGSTPTAITGYRYSQPIVLQETTTLKAIAVQPGMPPSAPVTARYVLVPAPPIADPPANRQFSNRVEVALRPKSPGSEIRYEVGTGTVPVWSLGKVDQAKIWPSPNEKLAFLETTRLSAVTVTGVGADRRISDPILMVYEVVANPVGDSLLPHVPVSLSNGYAIVNLGTAPIPAQIITFESLGARGFRDASHAVKLEKISPISQVRFVKPAGRPQVGVYSYHGEGPSSLVDWKDSVDIKQAGTYFAAVDTQPPALVWIPQAAR